MPQKYIPTNDKANSFGAGDIIVDVFQKRDILNYIDSYLGKRSPRAEYSYAEGILTWFIAQCRKGTRFENIYDLQEYLKRHPRFGKGMSPDTLLYMCKELAIPNQYYEKEKSEELAKKIKAGKAFDSHEVNAIGWFNDFLIDIALKLGRLTKGEKYILDYDTTHIQTKIAGARKWYDGKGTKAYCPAVAMINKIPVYIENRNGDSNASFNLIANVEKVLDLLRSKGIVVELIRIDAAGFTKEFTEFANIKGLKYIIRAASPRVSKEKKFIKNWVEAKIKKSRPLVGDTVFHFGKDETRLVVKKVINEKALEDEKITYWGLITNDFDRPSEEIIKLYEQRGDSENLFRDLKGFGWKKLPMRNISHNTVYLYITALNYILYRFITKLFSSKMSNVWETMRLETFIAKFMGAVTKWEGDILLMPPRYMILSGFT